MDGIQFTLVVGLVLLGLLVLGAVVSSNRKTTERFDKFMSLRYPNMRWDLKHGENVVYEFKSYPGGWEKTEKKFGTLKFNEETMSFTCNGDKIYKHTKVTRV